MGRLESRVAGPYCNVAVLKADTGKRLNCIKQRTVHYLQRGWH